MRPNFDPRRTKIDVKNEVEERRLLKIVLEPSWVDLGCRLGVKIVLPCRVALVFLKIDFLKKMKLQEATWAELGPTWVPKRVQNGAQEGAKTAPKATPKTIKKKHRFWGDSGAQDFSSHDPRTAVGGRRRASPSH